ncbi:hypothetical protein VHUM_02164 [Vanrija humicola]|uniref:Alpha N-terminal protein methyltransferase 1 n=1 Tax=Vanrija humicola TaxID=5417 RepID=A0A7D8Z3D8_VANHU|nr:hypothetical protein VHUM_02164 [Vanrija humicola]
MPPPSPTQHASKRARPNVGSALRKGPAGPDFAKGVKYWDAIEASVDGVLGGFGHGPVPHIDQLSSRLFLLSLLPQLHTFDSPLTPNPPPRPAYRLTALDVGAGIGRVTNKVLLPLFDDVVLAEPVKHFIEEAERAASAGEWRELPRNGRVRDEEEAKENARRVAEFNKGRGKRVWFSRVGLQQLNPAYPARGVEESSVVVGDALMGDEGAFGDAETAVQYDVIWCQWCLGHMTHADLVAFLRRAKASLRVDTDIAEEASPYGAPLIVVKENCCEDGPDGKANEFLDEEDSSLTRSNGKWLEVFEEAGLKVVKDEVQEGLPNELFTVKTWVWWHCMQLTRLQLGTAIADPGLRTRYCYVMQKCHTWLCLMTAAKCRNSVDTFSTGFGSVGLAERTVGCGLWLLASDRQRSSTKLKAAHCVLTNRQDQTGEPSAVDNDSDDSDQNPELTACASSVRSFPAVRFPTSFFHSPPPTNLSTTTTQSRCRPTSPSSRSAPRSSSATSRTATTPSRSRGGSPRVSTTAYVSPAGRKLGKQLGIGGWDGRAGVVRWGTAATTGQQRARPDAAAEAVIAVGVLSLSCCAACLAVPLVCSFYTQPNLQLYLPGDLPRQPPVPN